jgi:hypothetical protein
MEIKMNELKMNKYFGMPVTAGQWMR